MQVTCRQFFSKLAEDITWEHDLVENYGIPWLAPGKGIAHVSDFFGVVHKEFEIASFDLISFLEGNNQVAVVCRMTCGLIAFLAIDGQAMAASH